LGGHGFVARVEMEAGGFPSEEFIRFLSLKEFFLDEERYEAVAKDLDQGRDGFIRHVSGWRL